MGATFTADRGIVPHLICQTPAGQKYLAPVKLAMVERGAGRRIRMNHAGSKAAPYAMERDGRLVYALPGGGEVLG